MKTQRTKPSSVLLSLAALALPAVPSSDPLTLDPAIIALQEQTVQPFSDFFSDGHGSIRFNYRFEEVDQDGNSQNAHASTLRTVVDYRTATVNGFSGYIQFENTTAVAGESYNDGSGLSTSTRPVVADPVGSDLNQAYIDHELGGGTLRFGRQEMKFNPRFIGNVGWRQNHQSYDAVTWISGAGADVDLLYSYVNNVNRIFGDGSPKSDVRSDSHLLNATTEVGGIGKLTAYAFALDLHQMLALSTLTFGLRVQGDLPIGDEQKLTYHAEYATQSDYADNPSSVDADYYRVQLGADFGGITFGIGQELLGSDDGTYGFSTPLATGHAENGWADQFLGTPPGGLEDTFLSAGGQIGEVTIKAVYHEFTADEGSSDYGSEVDFLAKTKLCERTTVGLKYADYSADSFGTDTQKVAIWLTWTP